MTSSPTRPANTSAGAPTGGMARKPYRSTLPRVAVIATAAVMAIGGAVLAAPGGIDGHAGALTDRSLQPAQRITVEPPPSTMPTPASTTPQVPSSTESLPDATGSTTTVSSAPTPSPGQIMFPVDAQADCGVSDNFGDYRSPTRVHEGLDITGSADADVYAVVSGRLTTRYTDRGLTSGAGNGWTLVDEYSNVTYRYFHLATHAANLEVGDLVVAGQVIGTVGNTGTSGANSNSNFHLHFEYRPGNAAVDPRPLLVRHPNCSYYD